jgi:hypothetical protein
MSGINISSPMLSEMMAKKITISTSSSSPPSLTEEESKLKAKDYTAAVLASGDLTVSLINGSTCLSGAMPFVGEGLIMADALQPFGDKVSHVHQFPLLTEVVNNKDPNQSVIRGHLLSTSHGYAEIALPSGARCNVQYTQLKSDVIPLNHVVGDAKHPQDMKLIYRNGNGLTVTVHSHIIQSDSNNSSLLAANNGVDVKSDGGKVATAPSNAKKKRTRSEMSDDGTEEDSKSKDDKRVETIVQSLAVHSNLPYMLRANKLKISFQGQHDAPRSRNGGGHAYLTMAACSAGAKSAAPVMDNFDTALTDTASMVEIPGPFVIPPGVTVFTPPIRFVKVRILDTFNDIVLGNGTESPTTKIKMEPTEETLLPSVVDVLWGKERATMNSFNVPLRKAGESFDANFGKRATITVISNKVNWDQHTFTLKIRNNADYKVRVRIGNNKHELAPIEAKSDKEYSGKDPDRD